MKSLFLCFPLIVFLSFPISAQSNDNLPTNIKMGNHGKIEFYSGTESCFEDLEQYIDFVNSPELKDEFERFNSKNGVPVATVAGFFVLGLMSESAALGQIGQNDGRGKIYAISGVAAFMGGFIVSSISKNIVKKRMKKIIKMYNQAVDNREI